MAKQKEKTSEKEPTLEDTVERLEVIVDKLESGNSDLEKSIDLYLEGKKLGKAALEKLDKLERRIQLVTGEEDGELQSEDFDEDIR